MPFMMLRAALGAHYSDRPALARLYGGGVDFLNYIVLVAATYCGLHYLYGYFKAMTAAAISSARPPSSKLV
jgi:hypothetical protein